MRREAVPGERMQDPIDRGVERRMGEKTESKRRRLRGEEEYSNEGKGTRPTTAEER